MDSGRKRETLCLALVVAVIVYRVPPPNRDLVIERVSKVTKETDLKDRNKSKGVCVRSLSLMSHIDAKHQTLKLEISKDDLMKVYNPDFWPCGINIRRYFPLSVKVTSCEKYVR